MVNEKKAIFTIGVAAQMLDVHPRTLRIYEQEQLITPMRKGKWRCVVSPLSPIGWPVDSADSTTQDRCAIHVIILN